MPRVNVELRDGSTGAIDAAAGLSLMEAIRDAGIDDIVALCGGCLNCATCHVVIAEPWFALVGAPDEDEGDLLDTTEYREPASRLSCQVRLTPELDGLAVRIAQES